MAVALAAGCSGSQTGKSGANMDHVLPSGASVPGWLAVPSGGTHASIATQDFIAKGSSGCTECHGSDLSGGVSRTSCYGNAAGCHHGPAAGWSDPAVHGAEAKKAPGNSGFVSCQICHGSDYSGRLTAPGCVSCHGVPAPHPAAPWRGAPYSHADTNVANASVCSRCHLQGSPNNPHPPQSPAPAGTAPGCFNGTMCHNQAGHPAGWVATPPAAQPHGDSAKMDGTVPGQGFPSCQECHGNDFAGGVSTVSCLVCHGVAAPHAPKPWRSSAGTTYTHTNISEPGNAPVCYTCHAFTGTANPRNPHPPPSPAPAGTAPGCFNGTMCHNQAVPHPVGGLWFTLPPDPQAHGIAAKATPSATTGFAYCQVCHGAGTNFDGGSSGVSCFTSCHFVSAPGPVGVPNPPHPAQWNSFDTYKHSTTDTGNAAVCALCHQSAAGVPGCFNNTLCHGAAAGVAHPVPFNNASHYSVTAGTFPGSCSACHDVAAPSLKTGPVCRSCHAAASPLTATACTSCHASPPGGVAGTYANVAGAHAVHIALNGTGTPVSCDTCHNGLGPSLANLNHYNRAKTRVPPGDVAFLATYNARSGASLFDNTAALACSNVSCHGGQATPNWQTGALNVNTQCTNCHTDGTTTAQFNGPVSNNHNRGPHQDAECTACHNTTALAVNHFTNLSTTALEGPASATIGGAGTEIISYTPANRSCTPSCHGNENW